jgi:hypothetical protein
MAVVSKKSVLVDSWIQTIEDVEIMIIKDAQKESIKEEYIVLINNKDINKI